MTDGESTASSVLWRHLPHSNVAATMSTAAAAAIVKFLESDSGLSFL